jgi:peptide/nickel transport system permease protein
MLWWTRAFDMGKNIKTLSSDDTNIKSVRSNSGSISAMTWRRFLHHRLALLGMCVLLIILLTSLLASYYRYDPESINLKEKLQSPSLNHPLGTDDLGRDMLARLLYGGRVSISVGLAVSALSLLLGTLIGALAGFYGGTIDNLLMRLTDIFLSFPSLFVLILIGAMIRDTPLAKYQGGLFTIIMVIALLSWMTTARLVRATFLSVREMEFVQAARTLGATNLRLILVHLLPNSLGPIIVQGALSTAYAILTESGLSFLGFGIQPPTPTWGNMLKDAQTYMTRYPWLAIFPGLMIFFVVISVNFVGDGLRDALDPRSIQSQSTNT